MARGKVDDVLDGEIIGEIIVLRIKRIKKGLFNHYVFNIATDHICDNYVLNEIFTHLEAYHMDHFKRVLKNHDTLEIKFRFVGPIFKGNTGFFNHTEAYACGMKIDNVLVPKAKAKRILNCMGIDWVFN